MVSCFDHVGFLAPVETLAGLRSAAELAGFTQGHRAFPSTILAHELAQLAPLEIVRTTIFMARGAPVNGPSGGVEVFMPHTADEQMIRHWIRKGVGAHVAFRLKNQSQFTKVKELVGQEGFRVPAFMNGGTLTNPLVKLTALYVERRSDPPVRLEFCHYE